MMIDLLAKAVTATWRDPQTLRLADGVEVVPVGPPGLILSYLAFVGWAAGTHGARQHAAQASPRQRARAVAQAGNVTLGAGIECAVPVPVYRRRGVPAGQPRECLHGGFQAASPQGISCLGADSTPLIPRLASSES